MNFFAIFSMLIVLMALTDGRHHKKKPSGLFGFFPDFIPKLSHHLFKFAFKGSNDNDYEEEHYDEYSDCDHHNDHKGKGKHRFHKGKKVLYRPYYVNDGYVGQPGYGYQVSAPAYYASSHTTYIPLNQEHAYASQIGGTYDKLEDYNVQNVHQSLYLK